MATTSNNFVYLVGKDFNPEPEGNVFDTLLHQCERVIFQSIITSFELDIFIKDREGGDVDTIHNIRREDFEYKNADNYYAYQNRGEYNSKDYHSDAAYIRTNRQYSEQRKAGILYDAYSGKQFEPNEPQDLDHVISAKEIHDDRGRVLSGLYGVNLANSPKNLKATSRNTNRSKKADKMDDFLNRRGDEFTDEQKALMRKIDRESRASYNHEINTAYYTSANFWRNAGSATVDVGAKMGLRQVLGFVMTEVWFAVKDALVSASDRFEDKLKAIAFGIKRGIMNAKKNFKEILAKFNEGAISGILASLSTTLCNIFLTTAKNVVRVIRQTWASIVEASKILIYNPNDLTFSERMTAALKIIATGASVVMGTIVQEAVHAALAPHIGAVPVLSTVIDIMSVFAGSLCTGFLTLILLYVIDSDPFNGFLTKAIDKTIAEYKHQARLFEEYAAKLAKLNIEKFEREIAFYNDLVLRLETAADGQELNVMLIEAAKKIGISSPWGDRLLDEFMADESAVLHFDV